MFFEDSPSVSASVPSTPTVDGQCFENEGIFSHFKLPKTNKLELHGMSSNEPMHVQIETLFNEPVQVQKETSTNESVQVQKETSTNEPVQVQRESSINESVQVQKETSISVPVEVQKVKLSCEPVQIQNEISTNEPVQVREGNLNCEPVQAREQNTAEAVSLLHLHTSAQDTSEAFNSPSDMPEGPAREYCPSHGNRTLQKKLKQDTKGNLNKTKNQPKEKGRLHKKYVIFKGENMPDEPHSENKASSSGRFSES